jgi:hypothetical protein
METKALLILVFVAIVIMPATTKGRDPTAVATLTNVTTAGDTSYSFTVRYVDDGPLDDTSIDDHDIRVSGPGGFDVLATAVSATFNSTFSQADVTYSIVPPGGSWDSADNGIYDVAMQASQVFDSIGNPVKAGSLGTFTVMAPSVTPTPTPTPASGSQLLNISTRMRVQTGENVLIGGFIVTGNEPKKVIFRALGPSLTQAGITGALADPVLELHGSGGLITSNDNWKDTQESAINATGIAPEKDLESAIMETLNPGE